MSDCLILSDVQFTFGYGVGGEYPMAAGSAAERAEAKGRASARKRGREVASLLILALHPGLPHITVMCICQHICMSEACASYCASMRQMFDSPAFALVVLCTSHSATMHRNHLDPQLILSLDCISCWCSLPVGGEKTICR